MGALSSLAEVLPINAVAAGVCVCVGGVMGLWEQRTGAWVPEDDQKCPTKISFLQDKLYFPTFSYMPRKYLNWQKNFLSKF